MSSTESWTAPRATSPVHATVTVPGSKSQTNRALLLAGLAAAQGQGTSTVSGALRSRDTDLMIGALRTLGLAVDGAGPDLTVGGRIAPGPGARVDCGLAGLTASPTALCPATRCGGLRSLLAIRSRCEQLQ